MNKIVQKVKIFWNDETAVSSIEYALLGVLIAVVIAGAVTLLGANVLALYTTVAAAFK